jgi:hypothetical protein
MSRSTGFKHGHALRRLVTEFAEGAQYLALGTKHLASEGAGRARRYVVDFARGLAAKHAPVDLDRAAETASFATRERSALRSSPPGRARQRPDDMHMPRGVLPSGAEAAYLRNSAEEGVMLQEPSGRVVHLPALQGSTAKNQRGNNAL